MSEHEQPRRSRPRPEPPEAVGGRTAGADEGGGHSAKRQRTGVGREEQIHPYPDPPPEDGSGRAPESGDRRPGRSPRP